MRISGNTEHARFAVQVRTDGEPGPWMHVGTEYTHRLVSRSAYAFKVLRVQQMPGAAVAAAACYVNAGRIEAVASMAARGSSRSTCRVNSRKPSSICETRSEF